MPLAVLAAVIAIHASFGAGYVLDDWYSVRGATFEGPNAVVGDELRAARPGAWIAYLVTFGVRPNQPMFSLVVQSLLFLAAGLLALVLLRKFLPATAAALVVVTWAVQPNQLSLETWPSATVSTLSLVFLLAGTLLLARTPTGWLTIAGGAFLLMASLLTYEASIIPSALVVVFIPWLVSGRIQWRPIAAGAAAMVAAGGWLLLNWHSGKNVKRDFGNYLQVFEAHFGWGIAPEGPVASALLVLGLGGATLAAARLALPSMRGSAGTAEWLVLAGLVVMVSGSIAFIAYFYAPLGAGDRVNYISSLGGAMVWVGIAWMAWRAWRPAGFVILGLVLVIGLAVRWERSELWATAKADAVRILDEVRLTDPTCEVVTLGPVPIQERNVAAFLDQSNVDAAVQVALDRSDVRGVITFDEQRFLAAPEGCRVDIRPLSDLEPDVVVTPT